MTLRRAIVGLTVVGLAIAGYLTYVHYADIKPLCLSHGGCETVQTSRYSKLAGVSVALLGLLGYVTIAALLFVRGELARLATALVALIGFGFSAYLTYRELFTIKAICQWCLGNAAVITALAVLTTIAALRDYD